MALFQMKKLQWEPVSIRNSKKLIKVLVAGYIILVSSIGGLIYGIFKANKDSQVVSGNTAVLMSVGTIPKPFTVNTNEITSPLRLILFLPIDVTTEKT
jgi:hypothetical protein